MDNIHKKLQKIFEETLDLCNMDGDLMMATRDLMIETAVYNNGGSLIPPKKINYPLEPIVVNEKSFTAARKYGEGKTAVLNFANPFIQGGGVNNGAIAQEEDLCRCSNLYFGLSTKEVDREYYEPNQIKFKRDNDNILDNILIYSPGVTVIRDDSTYELLPKKEWYKVDVITSAAPLMYDDFKFSLTEKELYNVIVDRLAYIFYIAQFRGVNSLVLGAYGCGAFGCDPYVVSKAFYDSLIQWYQDFDTIIFAVYSEGDNPIFDIFSKRFQPL